MSGRSEWLPWRRDWSRHPNAWKVYVAYAVVAAVLGCLYLAAGNLFGIAWLALAVLWTFVVVYVRRRSRHDRQPDQSRRCSRQVRGRDPDCRAACV